MDHDHYHHDPHARNSRTNFQRKSKSRTTTNRHSKNYTLIIKSATIATISPTSPPQRCLQYQPQKPQ